MAALLAAVSAKHAYPAGVVRFLPSAAQSLAELVPTFSWCHSAVVWHVSFAECGGDRFGLAVSPDANDRRGDPMPEAGTTTAAELTGTNPKSVKAPNPAHNCLEKTQHVSRWPPKRDLPDPGYNWLEYWDCGHLRVAKRWPTLAPLRRERLEHGARGARGVG
jgi:hypothetical protein